MAYGKAMCLKCLARIGEVLHIRLEERHIGRRGVIDAQEIDADVALLIRRHPALDRLGDLEFFLLIGRDGVETRDVLLAKPLCDLVHALLTVELQLRDALDQAERQAALLHLVDGRLQCLRCAERLLSREDNGRDADALHAVKDSAYIIRRAVVVVRRAREYVKTRRVDGAHLVRRHPDVLFQERLVERLDRDDLLVTDRIDGDALRAEPAQKILLQLGIGLGVVPHDVDLRADDLPLVHQRAPARIHEHPAVIARENVRAREDGRLAVRVELFERRLIDGERGDARLLCLSEHLIGGEPLALRELQQPLVVDGELHRARVHLDSVPLEADHNTRNKADEDRRQQNRMIVKFLHLK